MIAVCLDKGRANALLHTTNDSNFLFDAHSDLRYASSGYWNEGDRAVWHRLI